MDVKERKPLSNSKHSRLDADGSGSWEEIREMESNPGYYREEGKPPQYRCTPDG